MQNLMRPSNRLREDPMTVAAATETVGAEDADGVGREARAPGRPGPNHRFRSIPDKLPGEAAEVGSTALPPEIEPSSRTSREKTSEAASTKPVEGCGGTRDRTSGFGQEFMVQAAQHYCRSLAISFADCYSTMRPNSVTRTWFSLRCELC